MGAEEGIREAVLPAVQAMGLEIWDVERSGASVRVLVERPGGVDLDALSSLSNAISCLLDRRDDLVPAGRYMLEVSSPGLERRLRSARHFASCVGEEVAVKTTEPFGGSRRLTGTLVEATESDIALRLPPAASGEEQLVRVPLASVERAHTVFRWPASSSKGSPARGKPAPDAKPAPNAKPAPTGRPAPTGGPARAKAAAGMSRAKAAAGGPRAKAAAGGPRAKAAPGAKVAARSGGAPWQA